LGQHVFKAIHTLKAFDRKEHGVMRLLVLYPSLASQKKNVSNQPTQSGLG
jgi:hypothetical protein